MNMPVMNQTGKRNYNEIDKKRNRQDHSAVLFGERGADMEDTEIIEMYWRREENAIAETDRKYGKYLKAVSYNITADEEDSREAVNDTYLKTWNQIPPERPNLFRAWLCRIVRSLSIDRIRFNTRKKRGASQYAVSLEEIGECIGEKSAQKEYELSILKDALNQFLQRYSEQERNLFLCRYFFFDSLKEAAGACGYSESGAKTKLFRMRAALKEYLEQEGFLS
jgi:RNA polymerase sigma-70 factor (ECF subfamily)